MRDDSERIRDIQEYLEKIEKYSILNDQTIQFAIERLLQLTIEVALDANCYLFKSLLTD